MITSSRHKCTHRRGGGVHVWLAAGVLAAKGYAVPRDMAPPLGRECEYMLRMKSDDWNSRSYCRIPVHSMRYVVIIARRMKF